LVVANSEELRSLENGTAEISPGSLPDFSQTITVDNQIVPCITPSVAQDGTVDFIPTLATRTGTGGTRPTGTGVLGGTKIGGTFIQATSTTGIETEGAIPTKLSKPTSRTFVEE
jgi:hypothetical protein